MVECRWTKRILVEVSNRSSWLIAAWPSGHRLVEFGRMASSRASLGLRVGLLSSTRGQSRVRHIDASV